MKVVVYHKSVPNSKSYEKTQVLKNFSTGVAKHDQVVDSYDYTHQQSDVGVIQGWSHDLPVLSPHLDLRNKVIKNQISNNNKVVAIDSNLFLYADINNSNHYLRYSFNGIFPSSGIYCDDAIDPNRWRKISKNLNISLKDWRTDGEHILLCLQRNLGWSMRGIEVPDWVNQTICKIRLYSDRPIVIRPHPGDKNFKNYMDKIYPFHNTSISNNSLLLEDLTNCWAMINYNSSPSVAAAIEGCPVFITDVANSQTGEISNDISNIEKPILYDRQQWVQRLAMFHWNFEELCSGECWSHMRNYV